MLHQGWSTTTTKKDFQKCSTTKFDMFDQGSVLKKGYKKAGFNMGLWKRKTLNNAEPTLINIWPEDVLKINAPPTLINNNSRGTETVWDSNSYMLETQNLLLFQFLTYTSRDLSPSHTSRDLSHRYQSPVQLLRSFKLLFAILSIKLGWSLNESIHKFGWQT